MGFECGDIGGRGVGGGASRGEREGEEALERTENKVFGIATGADDLRVMEGEGTIAGLFVGGCKGQRRFGSGGTGRLEDGFERWVCCHGGTSNLMRNILLAADGYL